MRAAVRNLPFVHQMDGNKDIAELFPAFRDAAYPVLLDGSAWDGDPDSCSYLTADPFLVLRARAGHVEIEAEGRVVPLQGGALRNLRNLLTQHWQPDQAGLPAFQGGAAGFFSYDLGRQLERITNLAQDDLALPDICVGFYDWALAQDHQTGQTTLIATGLPEGTRSAARARFEWVSSRLQRTDSITKAGAFEVGPLTSNFTREAYLNAVRKIKAYLVQGEIYQANLSQRFSAPFTGDAWALYCNLRKVNPAPFSAYLGFPEATILSASPELFLRLRGSQVETRPIKGTRPRGVTLEEDDRLVSELQASAKDRAENLMIVDLLRNDLGRVCAVGSVDVPSMFAVESHPTVHHLVSTVTGTLAAERTAMDLLAACFPGGSVTGAPKIRAMEIIEELEPVRRGIYCGAIGYIGFNGAMAMSIPIRTMVVKDGRLTFSAGGAVVHDSDPEAEYQETLDKVRGLMRSLGVAWQ